MREPRESSAPQAILQPTDGVRVGAGEAPGDRVLSVLRGLGDPLFGLFDAARDERVLALLKQGDSEYRSLYEGARGEELADFAPYLVRLPRDSTVLGRLVREGWGKSWGVYLTSRADLTQVRKHLRHFLMVRLPGNRKVYFRFYDPRVLRTFLPTCAPDELTSFIGPVTMYMMESERPSELLSFRLDGSRIVVEKVLVELSNE